MPPSAVCLVNNTSTINGVDVTASSTVTIKLADTTGVVTWTVSCITTDDFNNHNAITATIVINQPAKTATFTASGVLGSAMIFKSIVNSGRTDQATNNFGVYVLTTTGLRVAAVGETIESDATWGWSKTMNYMIRNYGAGSGLLSGAGLYISGGAYNVGQNADGSIIVNADDIQLKPAFTTLLNSATPNSVANSLVQRNGSGGSSFDNITITGTTFSATVANSTLSFVTSNTVSSTNSSAFLHNTGSVVDGSSGGISLFSGAASGIGNSGQFNLLSGDVASGTSGPLVLKSGLSSGSGLSGSVQIGSGNTSTGTSGATSIFSGNSSGGNSGSFTGQTGSVVNGTSGTFIFATGLASGSGTSGPLLVRTGNSVTGSSGQAFLQSGQVTSGSGSSGSVNLVTGAVVAGASGDINMTTGTNSGGTSGNINMKSNGSGVSIGQIGGSFGGGKNVIFIANATTVPNVNPSGGVVLYSTGGKLWARYSGGNYQITP